MRRYVVAGAGIGCVVLAVADALAARAGWSASVLPRSDGPWPWLASRAAGVTAFVAITLDVTFGLFVSTGAADRWIARARSVDVHRWLSSVALALVAAHALLLLGDGFVRFDLLDAVVPFLAPYRPAPVALGLGAAALAALVHASFGLRHRIGVATWKRIHRLTLGIFVLALAHGLLAGTDAGSPWLRGFYMASATIVSVLLLRRGFRIRSRA
jgi:sulfoxide reductase heme-binding subunit YedZ